MVSLRKRHVDRIEASPHQDAAPVSVPPTQEPQAPTVEEIIAGCELPDLAKNWLRQNPEFILDPAKNERLRKMHNVAEYQSGSEYTEPYFQRLEVLLGLKQETPSNGRAPAP